MTEIFVNGDVLRVVFDRVNPRTQALEGKIKGPGDVRVPVEFRRVCGAKVQVEIRSKTRDQDGDEIAFLVGKVSARNKGLGTRRWTAVGKVEAIGAKIEGVVLDESHSIKDGTTLQTKAVLKLDCTFAWCVSGTPTCTDGVKDLKSQCAFLSLIHI